MNKSLLTRVGKLTFVVDATLVVTALIGMSAGIAIAKKKEKAYLPDYVLKAQSVLVVIMPDTGEPLDDSSANRKAQEEVEKALMKWGRYRLALDANTADLVIGVRKGTAKLANPTVSGGPVDSRPASVETTDNQVRILAQQGRPTDLTAGLSNGYEWTARQGTYGDGSWRGGRHVHGLSGRSGLPVGRRTRLETHCKGWIEAA